MTTDLRQRIEERAKLLNQPPQQQQSLPNNLNEEQNTQQPTNDLRSRFESRLNEMQKQNRTPLEKYVQRPTEVALTSTASGFKAIPRTGFDLLKTIVQKTGGNIQDLEKFQQESPEWLKKVASTVFPTFEESQKKYQEKGFAKPESAIEKGIEKAGRFLGESPAVGGIGGIPGAVGLAGAAVGSQVAEELELPPLANAALTLGTSLIGHKVGGGFKELARQKITPEVERYIAASKKAGIDPLLTGMNPSQLQKVAQKWSTHGIGGPQILEEAYKSRSAQVARQFEKALDEIGENLYQSPYEAGEGLKESIQDASMQIEQNKRQLYRAVDETLPKNAAFVLSNPKGMQKQLENGIKIINDSLLITPKESPTYGRLHFLKNGMKNLNKHDLVAMPIKQLEGLDRSLNEVIKYEKPGGYDKLLVPFANEIKNELKNYGKINPRFATARKAANDYFADEVVHIRQNLLSSISKSQTPESTLAIMNTVSGVKHVEKALKALPNGENLLNGLKRYKLNTLIREKIIDSSTGLMKLGGIKDFLSRKAKDYHLISELAGAESMQSLRNLEHAGKGLEKGFNNLVNPSKSADTLIAINSILSPSKKIIRGIKELGKAHPFEAVSDLLSGGLSIAMPKALAKMTLNPKFANKVFALSQAGKANNWRAFNKILDELTDEMNKKDQKEAK